jgi:hypothetical protein
MRSSRWRELSPISGHRSAAARLHVPFGAHGPCTHSVGPRAAAPQNDQAPIERSRPRTPIQTLTARPASSWTDTACVRGRMAGGRDIVPHACPGLPVASVCSRLAGGGCHAPDTGTRAGGVAIVNALVWSAVIWGPLPGPQDGPGLIRARRMMRRSTRDIDADPDLHPRVPLRIVVLTDGSHDDEEATPDIRYQRSPPAQTAGSVARFLTGPIHFDGVNPARCHDQQARSREAPIGSQ